MNLKLIESQAKLNILNCNVNDVKSWAKKSVTKMYKAINQSLDQNEMSEYPHFISKINITLATYPIDKTNDETLAKAYFQLFNSYISGAKQLQKVHNYNKMCVEANDRNENEAFYDDMNTKANNYPKNTHYYQGRRYVPAFYSFFKHHDKL